MRRRATNERRQRLIAILLLAFCIDTLRPVADPLAHCHPGGDRPHVHAGIDAGAPGSTRTILFGAGLTPRPARPGFHVLPTSEQATRHVHLLRTLHLADLTASPRLPGIPDPLAATEHAPRRPSAAQAPAGTARAPPTALA